MTPLVRPPHRTPGWPLLALAVAVLAGSACSGASEKHAQRLAEGPNAGAAGTGGSAGPGAGTAGAGAAGQAGGSTVDLCPLGQAPDLPSASPRILVLGPSKTEPALLAKYLQGLLASDPAFVSPEVVAKDTDTTGGHSLMSFWYDPTDRDARLAALGGPFTWVVLVDDAAVGASFPEIAFEGARVLACRARAAGSKPLLLMTWSKSDPQLEARAENAYRVGNGTGTPVVPTGGGASGQGGQAGSGGSMPQVPVTPDAEGAFRAAASLYVALTGKSAAGLPYQAPELTVEGEASLIASADAAATFHAKAIHYSAPFPSAVRLETVPMQPELVFMDSGTSSEALWQDRMNELVPKLGLTPKATAIGACNDTKTFDSTCLATAAPSLAAAQFEILFARSYTISAAMISASGNQKNLTVQVWDRHYDGLPTDGVAAIQAMDERSMTAIAGSRQYGLAWTPHHLAFAKLKTARAAVNLTTDGTHATYPVSLALAAMSLVSRTSMKMPTTGLDTDATVAGVRGRNGTATRVAVPVGDVCGGRPSDTSEGVTVAGGVVDDTTPPLGSLARRAANQVVHAVGTRRARRFHLADAGGLRHRAACG